MFVVRFLLMISVTPPRGRNPFCALRCGASSCGVCFGPFFPATFANPARIVIVVILLKRILVDATGSLTGASPLSLHVKDN